MGEHDRPKNHPRPPADPEDDEAVEVGTESKQFAAEMLRALRLRESLRRRLQEMRDDRDEPAATPPRPPTGPRAPAPPTRAPASSGPPPIPPRRVTPTLREPAPTRPDEPGASRREPPRDEDEPGDERSRRRLRWPFRRKD